MNLVYIANNKHRIAAFGDRQAMERLLEVHTKNLEDARIFWIADREYLGNTIRYFATIECGLHCTYMICSSGKEVNMYLENKDTVIAM